MWNNDAPLFCKQTTFLMSYGKLYHSFVDFVFDASLVHGAMLLKASILLWGGKRKKPCPFKRQDENFLKWNKENPRNKANENAGEIPGDTSDDWANAPTTTPN